MPCVPLHCIHTLLLRQGDDGAGFVDGAGPQANDRHGQQSGVDDRAAAVLRAENLHQRARRFGRCRGGGLGPALRLLDLEQDVERQQRRCEPAQEHGAPAEVRADGEIQRRGQEEAGVVAGLQIARAHLAPILGPGFGDIGSGQGPFAADADTRQQAEQTQLPDILRQRRRAGEYRVDQYRGGEHAGAPEAVGDRAPEEGQAPAHQE